MKFSLLAFSFLAMVYQGDASAFEMYTVRTVANFSVGPNFKPYSVVVKNCGGTLTQIKLAVAVSGIAVEAEGVTYADGTKDEYAYATTFAAGYESSWIDLDSLRAPGKCVTSVYVTAQSVEGSTKPAQVIVYGNFK